MFYEPSFPDVNSSHYRARLVEAVKLGRFPTRRGDISQLQTILHRMTPYNRAVLKGELRVLLPQMAYEVAVGKRVFFKVNDGLCLAVTEVAGVRC